MNNLYVQLALSYRLSLKAMSELMGKNEIDTYNYLMQASERSRALLFLFSYECNREEEELRKHKKRAGQLFLLKYASMKQHGKKEFQQFLKSELLAVDEAYRLVKQKILTQGKEFLTMEDYQTITRYRLKYLISCRAISKELGFDENYLVYQEKQYESEELKRKLTMANDYLAESIQIYRKKYSF